VISGTALRRASNAHHAPQAESRTVVPFTRSSARTSQLFGRPEAMSPPVAAARRISFARIFSRARGVPWPP